MIVKASRITNLTDARYFAAKEVDYLGFSLEEHAEGYLDPIYMKAIKEWVAGPKITGEFSTMPASHILEAVNFLGLDAVQLNAEKYLASLSEFNGVEVLLSIDAGMEKSVLDTIFHGAAPYVSAFLLDFGAQPGWESLLLSDTDFWNDCFGGRPTLLQADFSPERLPELFQRLNLAGLSLIGGAEEQVGVKSFDELEAIFDAWETLRQNQ